MSYTRETTETIVRAGRQGKEVSVTFVEKDVGPGSTWVLSGLPKLITLTRYSATRTDPDLATTLQPALGRSLTWVIDDSDHLTQIATPQPRINDFNPVRLALPDGKLYGRSTPDAHADEIVTELCYVEGWAL